MKRNLLTVCFISIMLNLGYSQCGITGMQSQILQNSSFPIQNTSTIPGSVKIINGNYPTTIGVEDSNTSGISNGKNFSPNESGNIVSSTTTGIAVYEVELSNLTGCIDTVEVEVVLTLPVEWLKPLSVSQRDKSIKISFATASETNNSHFEIQHSNSGRDFQSIGTIEGHGNSTSENHYQFIHKKPNEGSNYYRVKQVDYDGKYAYSHIAFVHLEEDKSKIFPNPTTGILTVISNQNQTVKIFNQLNKTVKVALVKEGENAIDVSTLPSGVYYLQVGTQMEMLIKQ